MKKKSSRCRQRALGLETCVTWWWKIEMEVKGMGVRGVVVKR